MKAKQIAYWTTTGIVAFVLLAGGVAQLMRHPANVEGMKHLGYPLYTLTLIGAWKVLGGLVLLAPGLSRLKEWAYAGAVFILTGAVFSHLASSEPVTRSIGPSVFALLALASWALRPQGRVLGTLLPARPAV